MANEMDLKALQPTALVVGGTATIDNDVPTVLLKVGLMGGSAATTIEFFNGSATTASMVYAMATIIGQSYVEYFDEQPLAFPSKMFAKLEGTGGMAYVWSK